MFKNSKAITIALLLKDIGKGQLKIIFQNKF